MTNAKWHAQHRMPRNARVDERIAWYLDHAKQCACRPIPPPLAALIKMRSVQDKSQTLSFRILFSGGDRRSLAKSDRVLDSVRRDPTRVPELVELTRDGDWLITMRAMDLLEKLAHERPDWIAPHKRVFIGELANSDKWEIRLQIVRAIPLFKWTPVERDRGVEILTRDLEHPQKFVRAWALDSLATLAQADSALMAVVRRSIRKFERSGSKALASRACHVRQRLSF